ncbi:MAG: DUF4368 domain-containing protein [Peptococcaceae bacterium]
MHTADKSNGKRKQKVEIVYNGVGILNVPELTGAMLQKTADGVILGCTVSCTTKTS